MMTRDRGWRPDRRNTPLIGRGNKTAPRRLADLPDDPGPAFAPPPAAAEEMEEGPFWAPGDGDATLDGGAEGVLTLLWVGVEQLQDQLRLLDPPPCRIAFDRAGAVVRFTDPEGRPLRLAGMLRFETEVLRFAGVSVIRAWG